MEAESFLTLKESGTAETRVLGSRFFGMASPVSSLEDFQMLVESQRLKYHDATHVCFAVRCGLGKEITERTSDDGEPRGTAGIPILREIIGRKLMNVGVTAARYFGGTKLGTGNLARAYAECAAVVLEATTKIERHVYRIITIKCSFDDQGIVYHVSSRFDAKVEPTADPDGAVLVVRIPISKCAEFSATLREESSGRIKLSENGTWIS